MTERSPQQLFVPTFRVDECLAEIRECLEKGWTGLGFKTVEIENRWKAFTGLPHAHFLKRRIPEAPGGQNVVRRAAQDDRTNGEHVAHGGVRHA